MNEEQIDVIIGSRIADEQLNQIYTFKERAADTVAEFGGSWTFIGWFSVFVVIWIALNCIPHAIDPYPFILLNLILSCLSVFQAIYPHESKPHGRD